MSVWPATGERIRAMGYRPISRSVCRRCGARIIWARTPKGKAMPLETVDADGSGEPLWQPHFGTCKKTITPKRRT